MRRFDYNPEMFLGWGKPVWLETHGAAKTYCPDGSSPRRLHFPPIESQTNGASLEAIADSIPGARELGADRTGNIAFLLEGILGVDRDQLYKDYELTTFSHHYDTRLKKNVDSRLSYIEQLPGKTLRDKFESLFTDKLGIGTDIIQLLRDSLLTEGSPEIDGYLTRRYLRARDSYLAAAPATDTQAADAEASAAHGKAAFDSAMAILAGAFAKAVGNDEQDLTAVITNPGLDDREPYGWRSYNRGGDCGRKPNEGVYAVSGEGFEGCKTMFNCWNKSDSYADTFFVKQDLPVLPEGSYTVSTGVSTNRGEANMRVIANDWSQAAPSITDKTKGKLVKLDFTLDEPSEVTIGIVSDRWFKTFGFKLTRHGSTGIVAAPAVRPSAAQTFYDLSGRNVGTDLLRLPKGIS